jgi:hypothetical protein
VSGLPGLFLGWAVQLQPERLKGLEMKRLRFGRRGQVTGIAAVAQANRLTNSSAVCATSRQPWSIVRE